MSASNLLLVHGDERHLVDSEVRRWRDAADADQLGIEVIEAPAPLARIRSTLAEMPLFDPRRYVLLRDPPQIIGGRKGGGDASGLVEALDLVAPTTSVCIAVHQKLPPTNPVLGAVSARGGAVRACLAPRGRELRQWAESAARARGLRLPPGAVEHLTACSGGDLGTIASEFDKLVAFSAGADISIDDVRGLAGGSEGVEVWNVLERLLGAKPPQGAAVVDKLLRDGRSSQYLIATLGGQLRELLQAQATIGRGGGSRQLAAELKIPDWRAERLTRHASGAPGPLVRRWLGRLQRIDAAIKNGTIDDSAALRAFAIRAARELVDVRRGER